MAARTRTTEPANPSRGAGAPAPASAAATEPGAGAYYSPESPGADEAPASGLADFTDGVRKDHANLGERFGTADVEVAERAVAEVGVDDEDLDAAIARIRAFRKPLGAFSQKLALPQRAGYHRHWFNDSAGRIDEALSNGWAHVKGRDGRPISRCVGTGRDKGSLYAFAMEIPLVFWEEDQAAKNQAAMDVLNSVKSNVAQAAPGAKASVADKGKFYDPRDGDSPVTVENKIHRE